MTPVAVELLSVLGRNGVLMRHNVKSLRHEVLVDRYLSKPKAIRYQIFSCKK